MLAEVGVVVKFKFVFEIDGSASKVTQVMTIDNNTIVVESKISYSLIIVIRESCTGVTERQ